MIAARVLLALFAFCSISLAQEALPTAPSVAFSTPPQPGLFAKVELSSRAQPPARIEEKTAEPKIVTRGFLAWTAADGATIAADAITTVHCLGLPNCIEKNPMFGSHPSVQRVAATEAAFFTSDTLLSYWLKRKGKSWWWVAALANSAQGGVAAGLNLRHW